jgi:hypothetical protein
LATLLATALQAANGGSTVVLLTLLGGGPFATAPELIVAPIFTEAGRRICVE